MIAGLNSLHAPKATTDRSFCEQIAILEDADLELLSTQELLRVVQSVKIPFIDASQAEFQPRPTLLKLAALARNVCRQNSDTTDEQGLLTKAR